LIIVKISGEAWVCYGNRKHAPKHCGHLNSFLHKAEQFAWLNGASLEPNYQFDGKVEEKISSNHDRKTPGYFFYETLQACLIWMISWVAFRGKVGVAIFKCWALLIWVSFTQVTICPKLTFCHILILKQAHVRK